MADSFANLSGLVLVRDLASVIQENRTYLSEVDGAIGDGDHGINMAKGFGLTAERLADTMDLAEALKTLGKTLVGEIGGAMGPLYGSFFRALGRTCTGVERIDARVFGAMLRAGLTAVTDMGQAQPGDKTLVDTLHPAVEAYEASLARGEGFRSALEAMTAAAERGKESSRDLVARVGRASRLGERSRGALDAGATSCWLILRSMAQSASRLL
jgi:dihydroxyacetone kinase-like protein